MANNALDQSAGRCHENQNYYHHISWGHHRDPSRYERCRTAPGAYRRRRGRARDFFYPLLRPHGSTPDSVRCQNLPLKTPLFSTPRRALSTYNSPPRELSRQTRILSLKREPRLYLDRRSRPVPPLIPSCHLLRKEPSERLGTALAAISPCPDPSPADGIDHRRPFGVAPATGEQPGWVLG